MQALKTILYISHSILIGVIGIALITTIKSSNVEPDAIIGIAFVFVISILTIVYISLKGRGVLKRTKQLQEGE